MKNKLLNIRTFRIFIQLVCFLFLPVLFINTFGNIKLIVSSLVSGDFVLSQMLPIILTTFFTIIMVVLFGRLFCGFMCAFGFVQDLFYYIGRKFLKIKYKINPDTDRKLKFIKYFILLIIIILIFFPDINIPVSISPWNAFGIICFFPPSLEYAISMFDSGVILLVIIMILSMFVERFFCRYLCPLGAIYGIISKFKLLKINKTYEDCGNCKCCTSSCTMGIDISKENNVSSGECIGCMKCISACPRSNHKITFIRKEISPVIILIIVASIVVVNKFDLFSNVMQPSVDANSYELETITEIMTQKNQKEQNNSIYNDGVYFGEGTGFRDETTKVRVTVSDGIITDIVPISTGDDEAFFNRAFQSISENVKINQNSQVDAVTGATFSSKGIIDAVTDALSKAENK